MPQDPFKILVVEDNMALAGVVRFSLQRAGHEVSVARNGREACEMLEDTQFDLVVTDYQMPEMDGGELCQHIRQHPRYCETPVVLLTAKELELDLPRLGEELGVVDVFSKPFSPRELTNLIAERLAAVPARQD